MKLQEDFKNKSWKLDEQRLTFSIIAYETDFEPYVSPLKKSITCAYIYKFKSSG